MSKIENKQKVMKLTVEQIEHLYLFTRQHFVEYYDLQTELVDHLANGIEQQWQTDPNISFDQALNHEFKKFGVFGFMDVVEKRSLALGKKYMRIIWENFKTFFKVPKIILTVFFILITYQLLMMTPYKNTVIVAWFVLLSVFAIVKMILSNRHYKIKIKTTGKKWLLEDLIRRFGNFPLFLSLLTNFIIQIPGTKPIQAENSAILFGFSVILVITTLLSYVLFYVIPQKAEQYLIEHYPEYNILT